MEEAVSKSALALGEAIKSSEEFKTMRKEEDEAARDAALVSLYSQYEEKRGALESLTRNEDRDFQQIGALTRELDDLTQQISDSPRYRSLAAARAAYDRFMRDVNRVIQSSLDPASACAGDCSACAGCGSGCKG